MQVKKLSMVALLLCTFLYPIAYAQGNGNDNGAEYVPAPPVYSGFYLDGAVGYAWRDFTNSLGMQQYLSYAEGGFPLYETSFTENGFVSAFDFGYQWNEYFSLEAGWMSLPPFIYIVPGAYAVPLSNPNGNTIVSMRPWLAYLAFKFSVPIAGNWYVILKPGGGYQDNRFAFSFQPVSGLPGRGDFWSPMIEVGIEYYMNWNWSFLVQYMFMPSWEERPIDGSIRQVPIPNTDLITIGFGYKFAI